MSLGSQNPLLLVGPFPNGNYRIRSFIGSYVPMTPEEENGRPYVSKQVQNNNAQQVCCIFRSSKLITQIPFSVAQSNGMYTIGNTGTRLYLAGSCSNLVEVLANLLLLNGVYRPSVRDVFGSLDPIFRTLVIENP